MPTPEPVRLTDRQLAASAAAAHPLQPRARRAFLEEVAQLLQSKPELGDGSLHRLLVVLQRKHYDSPDLSRHSPRGKYR